MTTIHDVAKRANVSISTVSRVLNNSPLVTAEKRERVLEAIRELGYQPNALARGLIHRRTQTIGVLIPDVSNFFFAEVFRGMEDVAHARGWNVMICNTDGDPRRMLKYIEVLREKRVDGVIFTSEPVSEDYYRALLKLEVPVVLAATTSGYDFPSIKVNDEQASFEAANYLIEQGHRNLGMIAGSSHDPIAGVPRVAGFRRALQEAGIADIDRRIVHGDYRFESGKQATEELLGRFPEMTAIFAASDEMALGIISYAYERGIRVPEELSVVGFDNVKIAQMSNPPLTTVAQPLYQIGEKAADCLLDMITKTVEHKGLHYLKHQLIVRGTVKEIKQLTDERTLK
ncbi:LacI family DNA-binding transcriptional regulator [Effusibacillus lacus]|uniref:LacI family transcriptional regulator n=1 Tax=Effusibacillus lacus TaxID=1348429 RepID=A0A292YGB3_9BACL|nr:LacI family DNA-binding transcriptional regulator [Effusibacillus lacus]TCS73601.1 LacI family transcriptional regulator [Effusibacillus lacus]GAX89507.1 LacI family transcriptional regulator [Effusibacillus lacus]